MIYDLLIVGAGPAGLSAGCHAKREGLSVLVLERGELAKPGEDLPHVTYKMTDPFIYENLDIMVVGAGDAAIEGALALCEKNRVSVGNRSTEFYRLKDALERQINEKVRAKKVAVYRNATIDRFEPGYTFVSIPDGVVKVKSDLVVIRIGA